MPVVFHDCNLKRIMGKDAKIRDLTLEEIKAVHPADSMGPAFGGIRIPSLEEALNTCKGKISLNIEIKEDGTQSGDFVDRVIQLVRDKKMVDQCMITSFDYNVLVKVKGAGAFFKTGYITSRDIGDPGQYVAADQFMISIELVRKELVDQIHGLGKKAVAWTINDAYSLKKCEEYPQAKSEFYTYQNIPSYFDIPNSVYHSVMMGRHFKKVGKCNRLMIVGTPCQLKVMEKMLKDKYQELIKVCIFCKQQKTLNSTRFLAKVMKTKVPVNLLFTVCYRGKGWPGIVNVDGAQLSWNKAAQLPFGRRLWTVPGCNICGDPFGMEANADITLMDPWIIRGANDLGETLITVHTEKGLSLLQRVPNLTLMPQKYNDIEPALGLTDIRRKRELVPYFRGEACTRRIRWAGRMEQLQRKYLQTVVGGLPSLPFIFYRVMCKLPDWRNIILK